MKKRVRVFLSILLAVVLLGGGYLIGSVVGITVNINYNTGETADVGATLGNSSTTTTTATTQPAVVTTTAAPVTTPTAPASSDAGTTAAQIVPGETTTAAAVTTTAAAASSALPTSKEEVVARYNSVLNAMKASTDTMTVKKSETISMKLDSCSVSLAKPLLTPIINSLSTNKEEEYSFSGGNGTLSTDAATTTTLNDYLAPYKRNCELDPAGVATGTCTDLGGGAYQLDILLSPESSSFDGTTTVNPVYHQQIMDPLNLATIDLGGAATIASAAMDYSGATIKAEIGADGTLSKYTVVCPMAGSGTGKVSRFELTVGVSGESTYIWTFTK